MKNYFSKKQIALMKKLNIPTKVQDFLNRLQFNFEESGETLSSPLLVLERGSAHCFEGALLGAYILSIHGFKPLIMHLSTDMKKKDFDHVIAPFKSSGYWGALSKTNHGVLRYREPVYKNIRELAMSYFHEYFLDSGEKTLRRYSEPLDLKKIKKGWETDKKDLWFIDKKLDQTRHYDIAPKNVFKKLRKADNIEIKMSKITEFDPPLKKRV